MALAISSGSPAVREVCVVRAYTDDVVRAVFLRVFRDFSATYHQRSVMIRRGDYLGAVSAKPSGPWYPNTYALALRVLKDTPIPVRDRQIPASEMLATLREKGYFYIPMGASAFWENIPDERSSVGFSVAALRLKEGISPSEAFRSFARQLTFIDCGLILDIAYGLMLIEILGDEKFDFLINQLRPMEIGAGSVRRLQNLFGMKIPFLAPDSLSGIRPEWIPGQTFYLNSASGYCARHPHGDAQGFNLIYIGEGR